MKIFSFSLAIITFFSFSLHLVAQNYHISFAGTRYSSTVDSVKVENLATGASIMLAGTDTLRLTGSVGLPEYENLNLESIRIFPNPMNDEANIEIFAPNEGDAVITVFDMTGRVLTQIHSYLGDSKKEFKLTGVNTGFYLISIAGNTYHLTGKFQCYGVRDGKFNIEELNNANEIAWINDLKKSSKDNPTTLDMLYTPGEKLKFTGMSGNFCTIITDIPAQDKTITFTFILCTDGDNNNYPIVDIGSQMWMAENLKTTKYSHGGIIGTTIPATLDISESLNPKYEWAYAGNEPNAGTYGRLYTWYAVNTGSICPYGWHVPFTQEWLNLASYTGSEGGNVLKESGTSHWLDPNIGSTNETGFTALPGGYRFDFGAFVLVGSDGNWWSSNSDGFSLSNNSSGMTIYRENKGTGMSVRCIYDLPILKTNDVTEISINTAISGGQIVKDWGYPISERGVCWSSNHPPTILDSKTSDGTGTGIFISSIAGLQSGQTYYIRAYAIHNAGISYGNVVTFNTLPMWPRVSTEPVTNVTSTSALCGGSIISSGESSITAQGICWSINENPTIADNIAIVSTDVDSFTSVLTGLVGNTKYYVRAYATNIYGTGYGNEVFFATKGNIGSLSDIDGNTYSTIVIGSQIWMSENLKTTKYNDDSAISLVTDNATWTVITTPGYCWYNNDEGANKDTYGALYNWYAVNTGKLCPTGWHVPDESDWNVLTDYLGGYGIAGLSTAGGKLKEAGSTHWLNQPNYFATNETGFTALPGGYRLYQTGGYDQIGIFGHWWSSTEKGPNDAWYHDMVYYLDLIPVYSDSKKWGYSVRCLKD
jgi:uncharacterized protein (TIGR02145 family)